MMNLSEVFHKVETHLLEQGVPSLGELEGSKSCLYRGPKGLMCAIGCLIPDDLYDPAMEGHGVSFLFEHWPQVANLFDGSVGVEQLGRLQHIHDNCHPDFWPHVLNSFAEDYLR